jgi:uncharacterized protein
VENLIGAAPARTIPMFFRTAAGAEIDLLLDIPGEGLWAIEIKHGLSGRPGKGFFVGCEDLKPVRKFVVNSGAQRATVSPGVEAIALRALAQELAALPPF